MDMTDLVIGIDGGGSKTDAVAVSLGGEIAGWIRRPTCSPHVVGVESSVAMVADLVAGLGNGARVQAIGVYLSGLDLPREVASYTGALRAYEWHGSAYVDNDVFALLRAGTEEPDAVAVVCGTGINAVGRRADGSTVRFPALGTISGDWGGGIGLGQEALWHAARDADGRGPRTALTAAVCAEFGVASVGVLIERLHFGDLDDDELSRLAPAVFAAAAEGDAVADALVDRQAEEVVTMAGTCLRRLDLLDAGAPVVLGGGILQACPALLMTRILAGLAQIAPTARPLVLNTPPILGALQLTLESAGATPGALRRLEAAFLC